MAAKRGLVLLVLLSCSFALVASRELQEFESNKEGPVSIRAELIHRNHPESRLPRRQLAGHVGVQFGTRLSAASLYGDWAEYAMTIYLGTPVQKFVLIVDTGSDLLWVQCKPCIQCYNQTNPVFDPAASASYSTADCENCNSRLFNGGARCNRLVRTCTIGYRYGMPGSSIRGLLATENISFSNDSTRLAVSELLFGCMDNNTASFGALDGLVGMGRGVLSLPSQLRQLTSFDAFSYCLVPFSVSSLLTSPVLFGANTSLELVYTPILENPDVLTWYWVNMTGVTVGGVAVNVSAAALQWNRSSFSGGTIFDSGTSLLVLLEEVFTPVVQSLRALITYPVVPAADRVCYNMSGILVPVFPSVSLQFSGANGAVEFPLGATNLFVPNSTADVTVQCLAVVPAGAQAIGPNIIGNIAQADHYIETDLENMRIGWTSRDCSLPL